MDPHLREQIIDRAETALLQDYKDLVYRAAILRDFRMTPTADVNHPLCRSVLDRCDESARIKQYILCLLQNLNGGEQE